MKVKKYGSSLFAISVWIVFISVLANALAEGLNAGGHWYNQDVDAVDLGNYVHYSYTDIDLDSADNPHIVYRGSSYDLRYATSRNNCWSTEIVFDTGPAVARDSAIDLDANGLPHISFSYSDGGGEDLMYATKGITGTWRLETVYTPGSVGMESDIAVDSNGFVHIVHWRWSGDDILYSTNLSGTWSTEEITPDAVGWHKTTIDLDSNDHVHIAYSHSDSLVYTNNIIGTWSFTTIDNVGENPNMAIDANDTVHISYDSGDDLNYAMSISNTWVTTTVVAGVNPDRDHAIAVDADNNVHISYRDDVTDDLKSVSNVSGSWITDTVNSLTGAGRSNSIDVDSSGFAHTSYRYDSGAWPILYSVWSDPVSGEVFAGGALGSIVHYDGTDWRQIQLDTMGNLFSIWGFSNSDVYAAGSYGHVWHYDGNDWSIMDDLPSQALFGIWGSSPSNMYTVSNVGEVLHYDGNIWSNENLGITQTLNSVWGSSANDVFIVGQDGTIWHYDGNMWSDLTYPTLVDIKDIWGSSANDVFAVGNSGLILHYDGSMWSEMVSNTTANLNGVWGTSSTNVYTVGSSGTILHYNGSSWNLVNSGVNYLLQEIWGHNANSIFVAAQISQNNSGTVIAYDGNIWQPVAISSLMYANNALEPPMCMPYLVTLEPDTDSAGEVGTTVPYTLTLTNDGIMTDTFDLSATAVWTTTLSSTSVTLGAGESIFVYAAVFIPTGAANGEMDTATIMAVSQGDPLINDTATLITTATTLVIHLPIIMAPWSSPTPCWEICTPPPPPPPPLDDFQPASNS